MKNLVVANYHQGGKSSEKALRKLVETQIENSLDLGWNAADLVVMSNLKLAYPVTVIHAPLNKSCLTGSKMFGLRHLFEQGIIGQTETWWAHDLDAWQNYRFEAPEFADIGLAEYSTPKFNGGSVFLRASARDLVEAIVDRIEETHGDREEPAINMVLRDRRHRKRVTVLNSTYNVGCSAFSVRYERSQKPILVSHFHPMGGCSWRTHVNGVNRSGVASVSPRLKELLVKRFHRGIEPLVVIPKRDLHLVGSIGAAK